MQVKETSTGDSYTVEISPVRDVDYGTLDETKYFFNWEDEREFEIYKLCILGSSEILGLISFEKIPEELRIHIRLISVPKENKGKGKKYVGIAGNLIAHVARKAVLEYAEFACISLRPKRQIAQHYINNYLMSSTGMTLSIQVPEILDLIKLYDHE